MRGVSFWLTIAPCTQYSEASGRGACHPRPLQHEPRVAKQHAGLGSDLPWPWEEVTGQTMAPWPLLSLLAALPARCSEGTQSTSPLGLLVLGPSAYLPGPAPSPPADALGSPRPWVPTTRGPVVGQECWLQKASPPTPTLSCSPQGHLPTHPLGLFD
jgi:hypothetical protein